MRKSPLYLKDGVFLYIIIMTIVIFSDFTLNCFAQTNYSQGGRINILPKISINIPLNDTSIYVGETIHIQASALDFDGTIKKVAFFQESVFLKADTSVPYSFLWKPVMEGLYQLTARATDNQAGTTTSKSIKIIVGSGNFSPTVTISNPSNGESFTEGADINIQANATDPDGSIQKVEFYQGNILLGSATSPPYQWLWQKVVSGHYQLTAKAIDNKGAIGISSSINITVKKKNLLPTVKITTPQEGTIFIAGSDITIQANATDPDGQITEVSFYQNSTLLGSDNTAPYNFSWKNTTPGNYRLTVQAKDNNGAIATSMPINVIVNNSPTVHITAPSNSKIFASGDTIIIQANAADPDGQIVEVSFYQGSSLLGKDNSSPYSFSWQNVATGNYQLTAQATDNHGAVTTSETINIEVSSTPPAADLKLQYQSAASNLKSITQEITPWFIILNNSNQSIPLSELSIRYWYTIDTDTTQQFSIDFAPPAITSYIKGSFHKLSTPLDKADYYLQIGFSNGVTNLEPGKTSSYLQFRFNKVDWSNSYDQSNDYSFNAANTTFIDWEKVTLYHNGQLVWGVEPSALVQHKPIPHKIQPEGFQLKQNYPNPFNPETKIAYKISEHSTVKLEIYNIGGYKIRSLLNKTQPAGEYIITWDALDDLGQIMPSGIYIYRIQMISKHHHFTDSKKMVLIK